MKPIFRRLYCFKLYHECWMMKVSNPKQLPKQQDSLENVRICRFLPGSHYAIVYISLYMFIYIAISLLNFSFNSTENTTSTIRELFLKLLFNFLFIRCRTLRAYFINSADIQFDFSASHCIQLSLS